MNQQLKYIKGSIKKGCPADIYFYTDVDYWSVDDFLWEFRWLVSEEPSKINIHINSCGGCCVDGMSVFSRILDCQIPTACYNDGLAASMASVIWAAGQEVYMKDYALLMIHNPFIDSETGKAYNEVTEAFTAQLKTIYQKRFNLSEEEITAIMDGNGGNDGTFFTAAQAVEKGFIAQDHVLETPVAQKGQVEAVIKAGADLDKLKAVFSKFVKLPKAKQNNIINKNKEEMNDNEITVFAALLGMTGEKATVETVSAQINSLKAQVEKYDTLKAAYDKVHKECEVAQTELEGAKASVKNLTADLEKANAALNSYKEAEVIALTQKIEALVDEAIASCKIDKESKDKWVEMAQNNFELVESTLNSIPARQDISKQISDGEQKEAQAGMKSEMEKMQAEVDKVVGENFQFRKLN